MALRRPGAGAGSSSTVSPVVSKTSVTVVTRRRTAFRVVVRVTRRGVAFDMNTVVVMNTNVVKRYAKKIDRASPSPAEC